MKINEGKEEVQRALRSIHDAFDATRKELPNKKYSIAFGLSLAEPMQAISESEVASFIEVVTRVINQFAGTSRIALQLDIVEYSDVAQTILQKAQANYKESLKLAGKLPVAADAEQEA